MPTSLRLASPADAEAYSATPQFAVSLTKLVVMSIFTFGLYELYWCYKHWDAERRREQEDLSPFWRAFFGLLWGFSLFARIQDLTAKHAVPAPWSSNGLALAFLFLGTAWRLPDPYWLVSLLTFLPLLPVQRSVNILNAKVAPNTPPNARYSGMNVVVIVIGAILLLLVLWGTFFPEPAAVTATPHVAA